MDNCAKDYYRALLRPCCKKRNVCFRCHFHWQCDCDTSKLPVRHCDECLQDPNYQPGMCVDYPCYCGKNHRKVPMNNKIYESIGELPHYFKTMHFGLEFDHYRALSG